MRQRGGSPTAATGGANDSSCSLSDRTIFLKCGANGAMMVANPNGGMPIVDPCGAEGGKPTRSDDKV